MENIKLLEPLYILNNIRFDYLKKKIHLKKKKILDIGCGIGILSEKLAIHGGFVTAIDKSKQLIDIAKRNSVKKNLSINYINKDFKIFIKENKEEFDIIILMELIEHLDNKSEIINIFNNISHKNTHLILSSLCKNIKTYKNIIFYAEYIFNKLVKGTHLYDQFINIYELEKLINKNFSIEEIKNINYDPLFNSAQIFGSANINYIIYAKKI